MATQPKEKIIEKYMSRTDINKRFSVPMKALPSLPPIKKGSHAVKFSAMYGTRRYPLVCTIRKKGHEKPVFSGGTWKKFVDSNHLEVGDKFIMYKLVQDEEDGLLRSHFMVQEEKPAAVPSLMLLANVATDDQAATHSINDDEVSKPISVIRIFGTNIIKAATPANDIEQMATDHQSLCLDLVLGQPTT